VAKLRRVHGGNALSARGPGRGLAALAALAVALAAAPELASAATKGRASKAFFGLAPATHMSDEEFARMGAAEVGTLRVPFFWEDIQPVSEHHYDWSIPDRLVAESARNGIETLPFVMGVPRWLAEPDSTPRPPLDERATRAWKRLLAAMVERYRPGGEFWSTLGLTEPDVEARPITAWQVWNEPNAHTYWRPGPTAPERYAELLRISDRVIAHHDPDATVVAAGLFKEPSDGMTMKRFLERLYAARGAKHSFDVLALHPYARSVRGVTGQLAGARAIMDAHRDSGTPIWITELGWPTDNVYGRGIFTKTEAAQKRLLERSFRRILERRRRWQVERLIWFTWRDNDLFPTCDLCRFSGLFHKDLTPKPAWKAFVRFTGGSPESPQPQPAEPGTEPPPAPVGGASAVWPALTSAPAR
jgi:hypothetical protein